MEELLQKFFALCKDSWAWLSKTTAGFADATGKAGIDADFGTTFFLAILVLVLLGSACWAASIAACRCHNALPHFFLGLIVPWIYPAVILFVLDVKGASQLRKNMEKERLAKEAAEAERQKNIALNSGTEGQPKEEEVDNGFNQKHFEKIARNDDGSNAGPWQVTFNGNTIVVTRIIEALPEVVQVEFRGDKDAILKMRIPYAKIEAWEKIQ